MLDVVHTNANDYDDKNNDNVWIAAYIVLSVGVLAIMVVGFIFAYLKY